jgi:hypothetical protein
MLLEALESHHAAHIATIDNGIRSTAGTLNGYGFPLEINDLDVDAGIHEYQISVLRCIDGLLDCGVVSRDMDGISNDYGLGYQEKYENESGAHGLVSYIRVSGIGPHSSHFKRLSL